MSPASPRCGIRGCPQPAKPGATIVVHQRRYSDGSTDERRLPVCAEHDRALRGIEPGSVGLVQL